MKKIITKYALIYSFIIVLITGCGNQNKTKDLNGMFSVNIFQIVEVSDYNTSEELESIKDSTSSFMDNYVKSEDRIIIDYSFNKESLSNYSLCLLPINGTEDEYKLVLYDSDTIIQELPCGKISGTPEFSFDDVYWGHDLEIFFYNEEINEWAGLLFLWDYQNDRFKENFIRIPKYDKIETENAGRIGILSVIDDNDSVTENTLYEASDEIGYAPEIRKWIFEKDTKLLKIYDCLEDKIIFEGKVTLNKNNNIVNEEYYQCLFFYDIPLIRDYENDEKIDITNADDISNDETYSNKQEFLSHYGFDNEEEPFYQCYDVLGNLMIELYFDEETETGCGIRYETFYNSDLEKKATMSGFSFSSVENGKWTTPETYALKPYGETYNVKDMDGIENYEETVEYIKDGRPDYFQSQGIISWLGDSANEISTILTIDFIYKNDGTLFYKDYGHNPYVFASTNCSMNIYYDEHERIKYERNYITHGHLEYYYIYKNNGKNPSYCLGLDYSHGYVPFLIKYE
ncbi:MAG: hypothetical protein HDR00_13265 [Lachnospiraceae bacterium]|nr:hypothetical protein [Lachnospiraceae bacterium]